MTTDATFNVIAALGTGGLAVLAATAIVHVRHTRAVVAAEPVPAPQDPAVWLACHSLACAYMETPHDPSPIGLVCRYCTRTEEA